MMDWTERSLNGGFTALVLGADGVNLTFGGLTFPAGVDVGAGGGAGAVAIGPDPGALPGRGTPPVAGALAIAQQAVRPSSETWPVLKFA